MFCNNKVKASANVLIEWMDDNNNNKKRRAGGKSAVDIWYTFKYYQTPKRNNTYMYTYSKRYKWSIFLDVILLYQAVLRATIGTTK